MLYHTAYVFLVFKSGHPEKDYSFVQIMTQIISVIILRDITGYYFALPEYAN